MCGVSEYDREASTRRRPWPTRGCRAMERKNLIITRYCIFAGSCQKTIVCAYAEIAQWNLLASTARYRSVVNI